MGEFVNIEVSSSPQDVGPQRGDTCNIADHFILSSTFFKDADSCAHPKVRARRAAEFVLRRGKR